ASMPFSVTLAQAALSPSLGAPATPAAWQATQAVLYSFSPAGLTLSAEARAGTRPAARISAANLPERLNMVYSFCVDGCMTPFDRSPGRPSLCRNKLGNGFVR